MLTLFINAFQKSFPEARIANIYLNITKNIKKAKEDLFVKPLDNIMNQGRNECCKACRPELKHLLFTTVAWLSDLKSDEYFQRSAQI